MTAPTPPPVRGRRRRPAVGPAALAAAALAVVVALALVWAPVPLLADEDLRLGVFGLAGAVSAVGLAGLVGPAGRPFPAQGAFLAVGGYGFAALTDPAGPGWSPVPAALAAVAAAGALGASIAPVVARLTGARLVVAGLALLAATDQLARHWTAFTGGGAGRVVGALSPPLFPGGPVRLGLVQRWWCAGALLTLVVTVIAHRLAAGRTGRALRLATADPVAAVAFGVRAGRRRAAAVVGAAVCGGAGGVLLAVARGLGGERLLPADVGPAASFGALAAVGLGALIAAAFARLPVGSGRRRRPAAAPAVSSGAGAGSPGAVVAAAVGGFLVAPVIPVLARVGGRLGPLDPARWGGPQVVGPVLIGTLLAAALGGGVIAASVTARKHGRPRRDLQEN